MSTSLLYHCFGLAHQQYLKTEYSNGNIIFHIQTNPEKLRCSHCNSYHVRHRGYKDRTFRTLPIGTKSVFLKARLRRLECLDCGKIRQEKISYADSKKTYTNSLKRYVLDMSKTMTIQDLSEKLGMSWDVVKGIQKEYLSKHYGNPDLKDVKIIAIDEIAVQKGHKYMTVVMDLVSGAVLFVGDGKSGESLQPFFKRLRRAGTKIEAVAIDMSPAYIDAVINNLKDAKIVFDHFHIVKKFNDVLTVIRRDLHKFETDVSKKKSL